MLDYKIKIEGDYIIMTYEEIIKTIKLGYEYKLLIPNDNIEIGILSNKNNSIICYVSTANNTRTHIVDVCISKDDIDSYRIYKYKTIDAILQDNNVSIEYL